MFKIMWFIADTIFPFISKCPRRNKWLGYFDLQKFNIYVMSDEVGLKQEAAKAVENWLWYKDTLDNEKKVDIIDVNTARRSRVQYR